MDIIQLKGTEKRLYQLVAPLVMDPGVLKQNHNFPFRTSEHFTWFVAVQGRTVQGFLPVERKRTEWVINNYYVKGRVPSTLTLLVEAAWQAMDGGLCLSAVSLVEDREVFHGLGFQEGKAWTRYVKMHKDKPATEPHPSHGAGSTLG